MLILKDVIRKMSSGLSKRALLWGSSFSLYNMFVDENSSRVVYFTHQIYLNKRFLYQWDDFFPYVGWFQLGV